MLSLEVLLLRSKSFGECRVAVLANLKSAGGKLSLTVAENLIVLVVPGGIRAIVSEKRYRLPLGK